MAAGVGEQHRVIRRHGIERGVQRKALDVWIGRVVPLLLVPTASENPFARLGLLGGARHLRHDLVPGARFAKIEAEAVFANAGEVAVSFDESRDRELAVEIDNLRVGADPFGSVGVTAECGDAVAARGQGLDDGLRRIHRDDLSVTQD